MAEMSPEQFEKLLRPCWPRVRGIVRRFVSGADAEDVAQEIVLCAWERRTQLRDEASFEAWLARIALNLGRAALRRSGRIRVCSLQVAEDRPAPDPGPGVADADSLTRALATLTEAEKRTLALRASELTTREIAQRLAEPEGTTRARLSRGRRKLAAELRRHGWTSLGRHFEEKE